MNIVGPQNLIVGVANNIVDPAETGNPSVGCQIQNSSPYQLNVIAAGDSLSIQPFTAQTVEVAGGVPLVVEPITSASAGAAACPVTFVFLLAVASGGVSFPDGLMVEPPPQQDGPLTAAAILATVAAAVTPLMQSIPLQPLPWNASTVVPVSANGLLLLLESTTAQEINVSISGADGGANFTVAMPAAGTRMFSLPIPITTANPNLSISLTFVAGTAGNIFATLSAVNNPAVTSTVPGVPLGTYILGGNLTATAVVNNNSVALLPAPPAGMAYRLQRFVSLNTTAATLTNVLGVTSGAFYSRIPATAAVDNLEGLLAAEALNATGAGSGTVWLFYDLVTLPQYIE